MGRRKILPRGERAGRKERRSNDRASCNLSVVLGISGREGVEQQGSGNVVSLSWNLRRRVGGARIHITEWHGRYPPVKGEQFEVRIQPNDMRPIRGCGRIVWTKSPRQNNTIPVGVVFIRMGQKNRERLQEVVVEGQRTRPLNTSEP